MALRDIGDWINKAIMALLGATNPAIVRLTRGKYWYLGDSGCEAQLQGVFPLSSSILIKRTSSEVVRWDTEEIHKVTKGIKMYTVHYL